MADSSIAILHRAGALTTAEAACAPPMRPTTDIHQHLWPEEPLAALSRRAAAPRLVRRGRVWELSARGEPACLV